MALSVFEKKAVKPGEADLRESLGKTYDLWTELKSFVMTHGTDLTEEWNFSGKSYGWSLRVKNPKKVIVYMTPCQDSFLASFVFGPAATEEAMRTSIDDHIKETIDNAKVYAEGRGFRITVTNAEILEDIKTLVLIKLGLRHHQK